jgi:hypothetical protein
VARGPVGVYETMKKMCAEASTVLRAVAVGVWGSLRITVFGTNQGVSTVLSYALRFRISMLEVKDHLQEECNIQNEGQLYC